QQAQAQQQAPQVGQVVNGHRWDGTRWVPVQEAQPAQQQAPQVGQIVNGYQWNGVQWVPAQQVQAQPAAQAQPAQQQAPQVGQVVNGYRWDGTRWVPAQQDAPRVGQVVDGYMWDGQQWRPPVSAEPTPEPAQQMPQVGQVVNGYRWDGAQWLPAETAATEVPAAEAPAVEAPATEAPAAIPVSEPETVEDAADIAEAVNEGMPPAPVDEVDAVIEAPTPEPIPTWDAPVGEPVPVPETAAPVMAAPAAPLTDQLQELTAAHGLSWEVKHGAVVAEKVLAERTAFMSTAKLVYQAKFTVDDATREVRFRELLKETGAGLSNDDDTMSGVHAGSYRIGGGMAGDIAEQAARYGALYAVTFDYAGWRDQVKARTEAAGYRFSYGAK
ncbi:MAG: hypothetical protein LWW77_08850, partial [Propionibacteriales bacterium]|nr:hypothetical protein [Propionibacteriales bacterium]